MSDRNHFARFSQIEQNEGHALRFENEAVLYKYPETLVQNRTTELGDRFLPKPSVEKFDGSPMDYWVFVNRFEVHVVVESKVMIFG